MGWKEAVYTNPLSIKVRYRWRYALLSRAMRHSARLYIRLHTNSLKGSSALCNIVRDNTFSFISLRIRNDFRKYFRA
jgi:hypothetical protein